MSVIIIRNGFKMLTKLAWYLHTKFSLLDRKHNAVFFKLECEHTAQKYLVLISTMVL